MKNYLFHIIISVISLAFSQCKHAEKIFVSCKDSKIDYMGRIDTSLSYANILFWSGTNVTINFEGTEIRALLKDEHGNNYFNIIIDKKEPIILRPDTAKKYYSLAESLPKGKHTLEIFKRNEWDRGKTWIYGFEISGSEPQILPPPEITERSIEFYGNSITAGYAVEDFSGKDSPDSIFTNNYLSYSAITARHFNARYSCICKSGIGITISWFPLIMSDIYDKLNPYDSASVWDFKRFTPKVVVINLLQNDSWLINMPERPEFKKYYGNKKPTDTYIKEQYQKFVTQIRKQYPNASIICMLGNMDITARGSKWPNLVESSVKSINDSNIFTLTVPFKESPGHPTIQEQLVLADSLINFIDNNIKW
jgi:hypothetical protein